MKAVDAMASVAKWMEDPLMFGSEFLWPGRFQERLHISTRQYAWIVRGWVSVHWVGSHCLRDSLHATNQSDADLQEDRQPSRCSVTVGTHKDG